MRFGVFRLYFFQAHDEDYHCGQKYFLVCSWILHGSKISWEDSNIDSAQNTEQTTKSILFSRSIFLDVSDPAIVPVKMHNAVDFFHVDRPTEEDGWYFSESNETSHIFYSWFLQKYASQNQNHLMPKFQIYLTEGFTLERCAGFFGHFWSFEDPSICSFAFSSPLGIKKTALFRKRYGFVGLCIF